MNMLPYWTRLFIVHSCARVPLRWNRLNMDKATFEGGAIRPHRRQKCKGIACNMKQQNHEMMKTMKLDRYSNNNNNVEAWTPNLMAFATAPPRLFHCRIIMLIRIKISLLILRKALAWTNTARKRSVKCAINYFCTKWQRVWILLQFFSLEISHFCAQPSNGNFSFNDCSYSPLKSPWSIIF